MDTDRPKNLGGRVIFRAVDKMEQIIEKLNDDDFARVEAQRKWVREHYEPEAEHKYNTLEGKLTLLDTIIRNEWIDKAETVNSTFAVKDIV